MSSKYIKMCRSTILYLLDGSEREKAKQESNLGGTWRRICSLDTRGDSTLEVLRNHAL